MRESTRLHDIAEVLSDGARHRAGDLARRFGVSLRTIYRDMDRLRDAGLPIEGTRGSGYVLPTPAALPPLNLKLAELEALQIGIAAVGEAADPDLRDAARSLAAKVAETGWIFGPAGPGNARFRTLATVRAAIRARQKLEFLWSGDRWTVRPLRLDYARAWSVVTWRDDEGRFEVRALDRLEAAVPLPDLFVDEPGRSLADFTRETRSSGRGAS
ncbi:MAG: HTH domain-containing protein [Pseudomonadota bacterium]